MYIKGRNIGYDINLLMYIQPYPQQYMFFAMPQPLSQQYLFFGSPQNPNTSHYNNQQEYKAPSTIPKESTINSSTEDEKESKHSHDTKENDNSSSQICVKKITKQHYEKKSKPCDATNLNKNYSKAILAYAMRSSHIVFKILGENDGQEFLDLLHAIKNKLLNIHNLSLHTDNPKFLKAFQMLGLQFMKKMSVSYIYNSKVQYKSYHIKYIHNIISQLKKL